jgi:DNA ligase (NAD+)
MSVEYFKAPTKCESCGGNLFIEGVFLICKNESCCGNEIGNLVKWIKKLDLKGIAKATIDKLHEANLVKNPSDFYKLRKEMICELEGFGSRSANKIIETLNSKKEVTFKEFIAGLNISNFSGETAELLEENGYDTVDKILSSNENDLVSIKGIGLITAKEIIKGLKKKVKVIEKLYNVGIKIKPKESKTKMSTNSILNGESYCFTGAIQKIDENGERFTREKMWSLVEENGGIVSKSITKEVTYLVTADPDSNSSKIQKARKSGINIISEDEFFKKVCL